MDQQLSSNTAPKSADLKRRGLGFLKSMAAKDLDYLLRLRAEHLLPGEPGKPETWTWQRYRAAVRECLDDLDRS